MKAMHVVIKSDTVNTRGSRNVIKGNIELLKGFDFNANAPFSATLTAPFRATIDRSSGLTKINMPAFVPADMLKAPEGATHFISFQGAPSSTLQMKQLWLMFRKAICSHGTINLR